MNGKKRENNGNFFSRPNAIVHKIYIHTRNRQATSRRTIRDRSCPTRWCICVCVVMLLLFCILVLPALSHDKAERKPTSGENYLELSASLTVTHSTTINICVTVSFNLSYNTMEHMWNTQVRIIIHCSHEQSRIVANTICSIVVT